MLPKHIYFFLLLIPFSAFAQFQDDFLDGNFDQNPQWFGDTANFIINVNNELQLNATAAGTSQLYVNAPTADSTVWEFYAVLDFAPSTSNQLKIYLSSDNADLSASLNGYFVQIGESGSDDAIELRRQNGTSSTVLIRGTDAEVGAEPVIAKIRVVRDKNYNWSLFADYSGGTNFVLEGTATDNTFPSGQFFGIECKYTSTRIDKFFFDDFYIFPLYQDDDAPEITQIEVNSDHELTVIFNENLDIITASDVTSYMVNNGIGNPNQAILNATDNRIIQLIFNNNFQNGVINQLTVSNIEDEIGNAINSETIDFQYVEIQTAKIYDIIINEIFADPTPNVGLPEVEFIEIYNRSNENFNLENYIFSDASNDILLPNTILQSGEYAVICDIEDTILFSTFGKILGVENFPSLTNSGELLQLKNEKNELIDAVDYDISWYQDNNKNEGGWTLERIFTNQPCSVGFENWAASTMILGGTPCQINSIANIENDTEKPILIRVFPDSLNQIRLLFNEKLSQNTAENIANYTLSENLTITNAILEFPNANTVLLTLNENLIGNKIYTIVIENTLQDCVNNDFSTTENTVEFAIPTIIEPKDLLINEVLFNPQTGGYDFVEIYNNSDKVLNLSDLKIGSANDGLLDVILPIENERLIFPKSYLVLSENIVDVQGRYETQTADNFIQTDLPTYPDDEGAVVLVANGEIIDQFNYTKGFHFELISDVNGVSLERIDFIAATQDENNWHSAASTIGFATPGYLNSQAIQIGNTNNSNDNFWLEKTTFSPNNDGFEDALLLNYELNEPDYVATIRIFDTEGRLIKSLINNELLATKGIIQWQGTTRENTKARMGIYILHIQLFKLDGTVEAIQKTCILAGY
jgi:hypothetical protein